MARVGKCECVMTHSVLGILPANPGGFADRTGKQKTATVRAHR